VIKVYSRVAANGSSVGEVVVFGKLQLHFINIGV
jgi:hypothetical protein